jgi:transcriptional regulator with XRE-family HTH domain
MDEKDKIEKIMQIENMNSVQFASEIGIQGSTLSHILNGRNNPSLEVLKKILNRFRTINSDWLILDSGTMYRNEKYSQSPTLFPADDEISSNTTTYNEKIDKKIISDFPLNKNETQVNEIKATNAPVNVIQSVPKIEIPAKSVRKIIVYYTDNTFQEFETK